MIKFNTDLSNYDSYCQLLKAAQRNMIWITGGKCLLFQATNMAVMIDYGAGNLGSIKNIIRKVGGKCSIGSTRKQL